MTHAGANWLKHQNKQVSQFGEQVADLLGELYQGIYHIQNEVMKANFSSNRRIEITVSDGRGRFSTFDDNLLTKIVLLAHDRNIRASIEAATHGHLRLVFMKVDRKGFFADRHPTIAEMLMTYGQVTITKQDKEDWELAGRITQRFFDEQEKE